MEEDENEEEEDSATEMEDRESDKLEEAELDIRNQFLMSMFRPKPVKSEWAKEGTYPKSGKPTKTGVWSFDYRYGC